MGFSALIDIAGSVIIGGLLLLILFRMNDNASRNTFKFSGELVLQENLVTTIPYKGYQIKEITPEFVNEIFEMRIVLESYVSSFLAEKIKLGDERIIKEIDVLWREQQEYGNSIQNWDDDSGFIVDINYHNHLNSMIENNLFKQVINQLNDHILRLRKVSSQYPSRIEKSFRPKTYSK